MTHISNRPAHNVTSHADVDARAVLALPRPRTRVEQLAYLSGLPAAAVADQRTPDEPARQTSSIALIEDLHGILGDGTTPELADIVCAALAELGIPDPHVVWHHHNLDSGDVAESEWLTATIDGSYYLAGGLWDYLLGVTDDQPDLTAPATAHADIELGDQLDGYQYSFLTP